MSILQRRSIGRTCSGRRSRRGGRELRDVSVRARNVAEGLLTEERKAVQPGGEGSFVVEGKPLYLGRDDGRG